MPPAGSVNRARLYVPARTLWGALTAELTRHEAGDAAARAEAYRKVGAWLRERFRFSYLYPAERTIGGWRAWLPAYRDRLGLCWQREDGWPGEPMGDRAFRARLLHTRPGTAIAAASDTAEEGSLRETECIQTRWRDEVGRGRGPVAMVGYVFSRGDADLARLVPIRTLFVGGDTRYGLGRLIRDGETEPTQRLFGAKVNLADGAPRVVTDRLLAHVPVTDEPALAGDLELLRGWDRGTIERVAAGEEAPCWRPGSVAHCTVPWCLTAEGYWEANG